MNTPVREGEILAGKYRVDRVLGVGGMGVVVAAHHLELDDRVAIKFLLPEMLGQGEAVARFSREARAAVKIKSEHVARVSDVGKLENGAPYMVMEFLEGSDLAAWLSERGPLPIEQALDFTLQASEAIAEAHALGIVHRDLKPANLFVIRRPDGGLSIKVLDFGISKMTSLTGSGGEGSMTKTSTMMGSPIYMSPEQIQSSKDVDARGDIWALGVILYELITGNPPFGGQHMAELIYQIISGMPPRMQSLRRDVPEALERVILHCLEKDRGRRFASVAELAQALAPFAPPRAFASIERISGVMTGRYPVPAGAASNAMAALSNSGLDPQSLPLQPSAERVAGAGTEAAWGTTATVKSRGPWLLIGGAGVLVAAVVGVVAVKKLGGSPTAASSLPSATFAATAAPTPPAEAPSANALRPEVVAPTPVAGVPLTSAATAVPATPSASAALSAPTTPAHAKSAPVSRPASGTRPAKAPATQSPRSSDPWGESQH